MPFFCLLYPILIFPPSWVGDGDLYCGNFPPCVCPCVTPLSTVLITVAVPEASYPDHTGTLQIALGPLSGQHLPTSLQVPHLACSHSLMTKR